MNISITLDLDRSLEEVWAKFDSFENLKLWQPSLVSHEHISGEPGQVGAVTRLTYEEKGRETVLIETITLRDQPNEFSGTYEADSATNTIRNRFVELGEGQTQWTLDSEFKFHGWFKIPAIFMGRFFQKRTEQDMQRFKDLVEER